MFALVLAMRLRALSLVLACAACAGAPPERAAGGPGSDGPVERGDTSDLERRLDELAFGAMDAYRLPSIAYGVLKDGEVAHVAARGVLDLDSDERPATPGSVYHLASLAKPLVVTALARLEERGVIHWDDRVSDHVPYFRLADSRGGRITIEQMAMHVSGMPDVESYGWADPDLEDGALRRYVESLNDVMLLTDPGEEYAYSNMAYEVLGALIEECSGQTFEGFVAQALFEPNAMKASTFLLPEVPAGSLARPYRIRDDGERVPPRHFPYSRAHAPSSTLYSNVEDMLRWARTWLTADVEDSVYRALFTPRFEHDLRPELTIRSQRTLAWTALTIDGVTMFGHGGHDPGYKSMIGIVPEAGAAVVVMTNADPEGLDLQLLGIELLGEVLERDLIGALKPSEGGS